MKNKQIESVFQRMTKKEYLSGVKSRLQNDVKIYFDAIEAESQRGNHVGFFGAVRLLMPTIEAVASTIYRGERKTQRLLEKLGIQYPELVWQGFRHSLSHNDHLGVIIYRGKKVSWSTSTIGMPHIFTSGQIHIDTKTLYESLLEIIDQQIARADNTHVYVIVGVRYSTKASQRVKSQLRELLE